MELEPSSTPFRPPGDSRPKIPEPPPVRLIAVDDVRLVAPAGVEKELDAFYVGLLAFEREAGLEMPVYRAENFRVVFDVLEPPIARTDMRPTGVEVRSLAEVERKLIDAEIEFKHQRGLLPGQRSLLLLDPAGNWVELTEWREIR